MGSAPPPPQTHGVGLGHSFVAHVFPAQDWVSLQNAGSRATGMVAPLQCAWE